MLKWLVENGCPKPKNFRDATYEAVNRGHLEVLKWLKENGCTFNSFDAWRATHRGYIEVLK